jgi:hypothetical protein
MVYDGNAKAIIMFAGYRNVSPYFVNDTWELRPTRGDFDSDGDVDLDDAGPLINCLNGPDVTSPPSGCEADDFEAADLEDDSDVDERDFVGFQRFFTG